MGEYRGAQPAHPPWPKWATAIEPNWLDRRVLHHEFWIDAYASIHPIDELSRAQLDASVVMPTSRRLEPYLAELADTCLEVALAQESGLVVGEHLARGPGPATIADLEPHAWLETTALMRAIRRAIRA